MEERLKRRAALYTLIRLVDANKGNININSNTVKRVFNDKNLIVKVEYVNGDERLAADMTFDDMNDVILKWKNDNPKKFNSIICQ